jgi:crotonobetainyl-CoA:carnitine CoA-transferase CaiB-like acyl-CoA transferase
MQKGIYDGLRVLDLTRVISGPYCAMLLADMGADVIKIEKRGDGDITRIYHPIINGESVYHFVLNRNKRSMELDFRSKEGKEILLGLAEKADVIVENFRPGTLEKMGLNGEKLREKNPGLVIAHISGFGQDGPFAQRPGFDAVVQAMSGLMSLTGDPNGPPTVGGTFFVDYMTGVYTAVAILAALHDREKMGRGQDVETCLLDSAMSILLTAIPYQILLNQTVTRVGNRDRISAPGNIFKTKDGEWVLCLAGGTEDHFRRFAEASNMEFLLKDPRFADFDSRLKYVDDIEKYMADWIAKYNVNEIIEITAEAGITCAKVETIADLVKNPQVVHCEKIIEITHPKAGKIPMQGFPFHFSKTPAQVRYPAPMLGEHSEEILKEWLGFTENQINSMRESGTI